MPSVQLRPHAVALLGVAGAVALLKLGGALANQTSAALVLMLPVLFVARAYGSPSAITAAVAGTLALNYFFIPPVGTFNVSDPLNVVALGVFLAVALTVGELSARVRRRAAEAEDSRREAERLYRELEVAFNREAEAEALRRSDRLKTALMDAVTHELRTPITSIKASTTALLRDNFDSADRHELLEIVDQETDRLNGLVEDLVGAARLESHAVALDRSWIAPEDVVADAVSRATSRLRGHRIDVDVAATIPSVFADARALSEVIFQLLENAGKYSPDGSTIHVSADVVEHEAVEIRVDDEGTGIPVTERERIFEKFYRAPDAANRTSGLGMGLAIARGLAQAHGGDVAAMDRPGTRGARLAVRIPIGDVEDPAASAERA